MMAFAVRLFSKSTKLQGSQLPLLRKSVVPVRSFAAVHIPKPLVAICNKIDDTWRKESIDRLKRFEMAMDIMARATIVIDPDDHTAVSHYSKVQKIAIEKAGFLTIRQQMTDIIETEAKGVSDVKSYLQVLRNNRIEMGLKHDEVPEEAMMFDTLVAVEKEIKKPLLRNDKAGMDLFEAKIAEGFKKFGMNLEDLPRMEEEIEYDIAKKELEKIKADMVGRVTMLKKMPEYEYDEIPDTKKVKPVPFW